ncbi:MAG: uroporphyrinogen-III decarboxylase-like protein [Planctomycetes bacterium]|nr:uroporphyrinogen-III decarboxylase-like protein [Planctomycetota bacterium]
MPMTPRERWLALLAGEKPDRVPTDYWATGEVTARLLADLDCADTDALYARLHVDGVDFIGAPPTVHHHPNDPEAGIWGVRFRRIDYGAGTYDEVASHPLAGARTAADVHAFAWPDPDAHDFDAFREQVRRVSGRRVVRCGGYEPFLIYCQMRGMEQALVDLLVEPEIADAILGHLFDYYYRLNARMFEMGKGRIDVTYVAEDLGSQTGLLMGLKEIRRFLLPNQKRMADLARSFAVHIMYHTDGAARDVIPDLIGVTGIEVLNPIQWRCPGMEREGLVRDFGDRIAFHGAVDNQQTLPFGSPGDVRQEVLDNLRLFAWPARWICAPCHNLQSVSPTENIVAMYETVYENGRL